MIHNVSLISWDFSSDVPGSRTGCKRFRKDFFTDKWVRFFLRLDFLPFQKKKNLSASKRHLALSRHLKYMFISEQQRRAGACCTVPCLGVWSLSIIFHPYPLHHPKDICHLLCLVTRDFTLFLSLETFGRSSSSSGPTMCFLGQNKLTGRAPFGQQKCAPLCQKRFLGC